MNNPWSEYESEIIKQWGMGALPEMTYSKRPLQDPSLISPPVTVIGLSTYKPKNTTSYNHPPPPKKKKLKPSSS